MLRKVFLNDYEKVNVMTVVGSNLENMEETLIGYYKDSIKVVEESDKDVSDGMLRFGVTMNFMASYVKMLSSQINQINTESEAMGATLILETISGINDKIGKVEDAESEAGKIAAFEDALRNVETPAHEILSVANLKVPMLENMKNDFKIMADFLVAE